MNSRRKPGCSSRQWNCRVGRMNTSDGTRATRSRIIAALEEHRFGEHLAGLHQPDHHFLGHPPSPRAERCLWASRYIALPSSPREEHLAPTEHLGDADAGELELARTRELAEARIVEDPVGVHHLQCTGTASLLYILYP